MEGGPGRRGQDGGETNPPPAGPLAAAVARWNAARNGGNALTADDVTARLPGLGLGHVAQRPTVPGGPILVIGQRPPGQHRPG